jgi:hypothetical protein
MDGRTRAALIRRSLAIAGGASLAALAVLPVSAHAVKQVGTYSLAIGWAAEPAYSGFDNAVQVLVNDAAGKGVPDLKAGDLKVQVSLGGQTGSTLDIAPAFDPDGSFGTPGDYRADLIPTAPGSYTFHVTGSVHGTAVDQTVSAGDQTFSVVKDPSEAQFPIKLPSGTAVSQQLDRTATRLAAAQAAADNARKAAADASSSADRALVVGIVALVAGVVLGGGGVALAARRRKVA